jgi:succinate dehydrogenase / fumarate reductase, cytochrome b subunit
VLHLPQLVGLALGIEPAILGLDRHIVATQAVLGKLKQ